jgi:hypothetical protein
VIGAYCQKMIYQQQHEWMILSWWLIVDWVLNQEVEETRDGEQWDQACDLPKMRIRKITPNVGIEPTTTRLRVVRSTDWAN